MRTLGHLYLASVGQLPVPPGSLACCWSPVGPPAVAAGQPARLGQAGRAGLDCLSVMVVTTVTR